MSSLAIEGFYTLCLRDALRPEHSSTPSLSRAASDLVIYAQSRGVDQSTLLTELDRTSHSVEWITSFEIAVHTEALALGRAALAQAFRAMPGLLDAQSPPGQQSAHTAQADDLFQ